MEAVDILFPWRKRPPPPQQSQQQPPPPNSSGGGGGHHSLPHPQEHTTQHYQQQQQQQTSSFNSAVSGRSRGPQQQQQQTLQRSFNNTGMHGGGGGGGETTIGTSDNYRQQFGGGAVDDDDQMTTYSMEMSAKQLLHHHQRQKQQQQPGVPKYRPPLDNSNRSGMSSERSGMSMSAGSLLPYHQQNQYYGHSSSSSYQGQYPHPQQQQQQQQQQRGGSNNMHHVITEEDEEYNMDDDYDDDILEDDELNFNGGEEQQLPISPYRQLIDAINMSILPTSLRLSSLAQACEFFDHRDKSIHDAELCEGAAFVLYHKLAFVLRLSRCGEIDGEMEERASNKLMMMMMNSGGGVGVGSGGVEGNTKDNNNNHLGGSFIGGSGSRSAAMAMNHQQSYQRHLANSTNLQKQSEHDKEIAMICSCLEMIHRANPDAIAQTWDECGTEILPLLVSVLERPFQKIENAVWNALYSQNMSGGGGGGGGGGAVGGVNNVPGSLERAVAMAVTRDQKLAAQKVTKVLAMYSLVPEAKSPMCKCEGMLRWLTRIIDTHNYNRVKPGTPAFGGSASLTSSFRGKSGNGKVGGGGGGGGSNLRGSFNSEMSDEAKKDSAKRLELASRATSGSGLYMTEAARFNTIATLTNLAALESNRMSMLLEPGLLDNICRAVHNEHSDVPKQCSALAIMNLSNGDMDNVPEMASNDMVLDTLLKLIREDSRETRRNAVVTIFNIACSDLNTVRLARYRDGMILEALTELVGSDDPVRLHDEARSNAAETLFNMACSDISETTDRMANHAGLLECLAVVLRGEHTGLEVKMYCSATLRRMAELICHPMIAQGALLSALVKAATWTSTDCIAEAFRAQASEPENCVIMAHHHGLLNALSRLALTRGDDADVDKVRRAAVGAIELMSRQDEARALLAHNEGIIMALTKASYGDDGSLNDSLTMTRQSMVSATMDDTTFDQQSYGRFEGDEDGEEEEASVQSRRIQLALKNLVSAM